MSIEVVGQQKYDLQDLACVELALRFSNHEGAELRIESDEDAELLIPGEGGPARVEVQVKGSAAAVTLSRVAECLAHFPKKKSTDCLIQRVQSDPLRMAFLIMSGRCDDASSRYLVPPGRDFTPHPEGTIRIADASELLKQIGTIKFPNAESGDLKAAREARCKEIAAWDPKESRRLLHRVLIRERVDADELRAACERLLRGQGIPTSAIEDVIGRMVTEVKKAKSDLSDALSRIRKVLDAARPDRLLVGDYVLRGQEGAWQEQLARNHLLLLSGPPRTGKTHAARWVGDALRRQGFEVQEGSDVETAQRFLMRAAKYERAFLLDDPLGAITPVQGAVQRLEGIRALIPLLRPHRKLIITQSEHLLLEVMRRRSLAECALTGVSWQNLGALGADFLSQLWQRMVEASGIPAALADMVREALASGKLLLEPGCLRHLAFSHDRLEGDFSLAAIERLAREDAGDLGRTLAQGDETMEGLLAALAIGSAPSVPITERELAFILGAGGASLPGLMSFGTSLVLDPNRSGEEPLVYDTSPILEDGQERKLEELERRKFVERKARNAVALAHPFYRAAAEAILRAPTARLARKALRMAERALFSLAPATSRAAARSLDFLHGSLSELPEQQASLVEIAERGLESRYPATWDLCFMFLVKRLPELPREHRSRILAWAQGISSLSLDEVQWHDGDAILPDTEDLLAPLMRRLQRVPREEVAAELALLNSEEGTLPPESAARVLSFLRGEPTQMSAMALERLLGYDEAIIRAESLRIWLVEPRADDEELLALALADPHPATAQGALEAMIESWVRYDENRQQMLLGALERAVASPQIATVLLETLVRFDRVEVTGDTPPWPVFERMLVAVMRALPPDARFVDAHLFHVAQEACQNLPAASMIAICDAWLGWLERVSADGLFLGDYALAVLDILMQATRVHPGLRGDRIRRALAFTGTSALLVFIKDLVDSWDELLPDEREVILALLSSTRRNIRWLQAAALTRSVVPPELQQQILGNSEVVGNADSIRRTFGAELFSAAIAVRCGQPSVLQDLSLSGRRSPVWDEVIGAVAQDPDHRDFRIAIQNEVASKNGARIAATVRAARPDQRERLFSLLLQQKIRWKDNWLGEAWEALLARAPDEAIRSAWLTRMERVCPEVLLDLCEARDWLPESWRLLFQRLPSDVQVLRLLLPLLRVPTGALTPVDVEAARVGLVKLFRAHPPRLLGSCNRIVELFEAKKLLLGELEQFVQDRRTEILAERSRLREEAYAEEAHEEPPLPDDWIKP